MSGDGLLVVEERVKPWLQPHLDRRLRDPVGYRRDAQHPHAPGLLASAEPNPQGLILAALGQGPYQQLAL